MNGFFYFFNIYWYYGRKNNKIFYFLFTNKKFFKNMILWTICIVMYYKFLYLWKINQGI